MKQSHYRPGQALTVPGGWGSQISWRSAPRLPLPSGNIPGNISVSGWINSKATVRPGGLIPMTPSGIEPASFCLVTQCLNQLRYCVPLFNIYRLQISAFNYKGWWINTKKCNLVVSHRCSVFCRTIGVSVLIWLFSPSRYLPLRFSSGLHVRVKE